ncbi:MAG: hypothetical protein AAF566_06930 [Pseudomonadota bacterium]
MSTIHPLLLYLLVVLEFCGYVIPVFVATAGLRRALRSCGFNRWLYLYISLFSILAVGLLSMTGREETVTYVSVQLGAWLTLPLWLSVREMTRQTRVTKRVARRQPAVPTRPSPELAR